MTNVLDKIKAYKIKEVKDRKLKLPMPIMEEKAKCASEVRGFQKALILASSKGFGLIAEIKKASPSKGVIKEDFNHIEIAKEYERGGAACLSILTDTPSFQGSPEYLKDIRRNTKLPILRKDFIIDTYQIIESRSWGTDCILLIMKILKNKEQHEIQVIFTEISRNKDGEPEFRDFEFQVDEEKYFYPASTIKLPIITVSYTHLTLPTNREV